MKHDPTEGCVTCKYGTTVEADGPTYPWVCRRHAPTPPLAHDPPAANAALLATWPEVRPDDWCGEWCGERDPIPPDGPHEFTQPDVGKLLPILPAGENT